MRDVLGSIRLLGFIIFLVAPARAAREHFGLPLWVSGAEVDDEIKGGTQYKFDKSTQELLDEGYIKEIKK